MSNEEILNRINDAEVVLIGLGEDFNDIKRLKNDLRYTNGLEELKCSEVLFLQPLWAEFCSRKLDDFLGEMIEKLQELLIHKNYYMISLATDSRIANEKWKYNKMVMPCGNNARFQNGDEIEYYDEAVKEELYSIFEILYMSGKLTEDTKEKCKKLGVQKAPNTIMTDNYNENGYLKQWDLYTRWLPTTMNKKLLVLELGVGMKYPSVIRWPFEKITYYNNKAYIIRVHETLYQLTEELREKGTGIAQNAIEWLRDM